MEMTIELIFGQLLVGVVVGLCVAVYYEEKQKRRELLWGKAGIFVGCCPEFVKASKVSFDFPNIRRFQSHRLLTRQLNTRFKRRNGYVWH